MLWENQHEPIIATNQFYEPGESRDNYMLTIFHQSLPYNKIDKKMPDRILIEDQSLLDELVRQSVQNGLN